MTARGKVAGRLALALGVVGLAACKTRDTEMVSDTAMMAGIESLAASNPALGGLTDANIVAILDGANVADSAGGALAAERATNADVREFGRTMMTEHHAMRERGEQLARQLDLAPQAPPTAAEDQASTRQRLDSLRAMSRGAAWDRAYIAHAVREHESVLQQIDRALQAAQRAELKALLQEARPAVQHHLQRAQEIQRSLGAA